MDISELSARMADSISAELGYGEDKKEIIAYGIESLILALIGFAAVLLVASLLKVLFPAAMAAIFGGLLRKMSGGAHFNSPWKCLVSGAVVYSLLGLLAKQMVEHSLYTSELGFLVLIASLIVVALFAPVDCEAKPIHSPVFRRKLKVSSVGFIIFACVIILISNNFLLNTSVVLGIGYQTITLLPVFNKRKKEVPV